MIKLFPYTLLRIAGGPLNEFQQTELIDTPRILAELQQAAANLDRVAQNISEQLYAFIPITTDSSHRKNLIKIRRDVHNHRSIAYVGNEIQAQLPIELRKLITRYKRLQEKILRLHEKGEQTYEKETKKSKKDFATLLRQPALQNGLLLSSDTIRDSLIKYLESQSNHNSTILKSERSFMKYLSRMHTKPTPFSTFTNLAIAAIGNENSASFVTSKSNTPIKANSHIHLNHQIYQHIFELLVQHPEVRKHLPIILNFTIQKTEKNEFIFLTNSYNRESFQYVTITPALKIFYTLMASDRQWTYQELIKEIMSKRYILASEKEIAAYVDQLLEIGFFEFNIGASGTTRDGDKKLTKQLAALGNQLALVKSALNDLETLQMLALRYQHAGTLQRTQLLTEAHSVFKNIQNSLQTTKEKTELNKQSNTVFRHLHNTSFTLKPHQLWYEDTGFSTQFVLSSRLKEPLRSLGDLVSRTGSFDKCHEERDAMAHFFVTAYGNDAVISLLQFYRDYSQQVKKVKKREYLNNPSTLERRKNNQKMLRIFMQRINDQLQSDDIQLTRHHVAHMPVTSSSSSFAAFFQAYENAGNPRLVINKILEGHGRMYSRFLYLFDPKLTDTLRIWNKPKRNILAAEPIDASVFNANLHERLLPNEIVMPGGQPALPPAAQIRVTDLDVVYRQEQKRLILIHKKSGKEVQVFNLDLQEITDRSEFYNLLNFFTSEPHHSLSRLTNHINQRVKSKKTDGEIVVLPRITYANQIIIQRKTWQIPKAHLPEWDTKQTDWSYFLTLNAWRHNLGIPNEVFIRDNAKPQYISFSNPFLVSLFGSIVQKCAHNLHIEEMVPHGEHLFTINAKESVVEFLSQWHNTNSNKS